MPVNDKLPHTTVQSCALVSTCEPMSCPCRLDRGRSLRPSARLPFLDRARPIAFQEAGQGAVGEHLPPCLAARAVIGLALRVDDALHRGAADWARPAEASVDGHVRAEGRDLLRE